MGYTGNLAIERNDFETLVALLKAAHRYAVSNLVNECIRSLSSELTERLALELLLVADLLGVSTLRSTCVDFLTSSSDRMVAVQQLPEFQKLLQCPSAMAAL